MDPLGKTQLAKLEGSVWWGQRSKWEPKLLSIVVLSQTAQPAQLPLQLSHSNLTYEHQLLFSVYSSLAKHLHTSTHTRMFTCPNLSFKLTVYNCLHRTFYMISIMYSETLWSPRCFHSPQTAEVTVYLCLYLTGCRVKPRICLQAGKNEFTIFDEPCIYASSYSWNYLFGCAEGGCNFKNPDSSLQAVFVWLLYCCLICINKECSSCLWEDLLGSCGNICDNNFYFFHHLWCM